MSTNRSAGGPGAEPASRRCRHPKRWADDRGSWFIARVRPICAAAAVQVRARGRSTHERVRERMGASWTELSRSFLTRLLPLSLEPGPAAAPGPRGTRRRLRSQW